MEAAHQATHWAVAGDIILAVAVVTLVVKMDFLSFFFVEPSSAGDGGEGCGEVVCPTEIWADDLFDWTAALEDAQDRVFLVFIVWHK